MKRYYLVCFLLGVIFHSVIISFYSEKHNHKLTATKNDISVFFSPKGGCEEAIIKEISKAQTQLRIQAYSFTSKGIADALIDAKRRKVDVQVILDNKHSIGKGEMRDVIKSAGIEVYLDSKHPIAHNKIIIIDDKTVISGSVNFTNQAEKYNAENLLIINNPDLAQKYINNWNLHKSHSSLAK